MKKYWLVILSVTLLTACKVKKDVYLFTGFHEPANEGLRLLYSDDAYHWTDLNHIFINPK